MCVVSPLSLSISLYLSLSNNHLKNHRILYWLLLLCFLGLITLSAEVAAYLARLVFQEFHKWLRRWFRVHEIKGGWLGWMFVFCLFVLVRIPVQIFMSFCSYRKLNFSILDIYIYFDFGCVGRFFVLAQAAAFGCVQCSSIMLWFCVIWFIYGIFLFLGWYLSVVVSEWWGCFVVGAQLEATFSQHTCLLAGSKWNELGFVFGYAYNFLKQIFYPFPWILGSNIFYLGAFSHGKCSVYIECGRMSRVR